MCQAEHIVSCLNSHSFLKDVVISKALRHQPVPVRKMCTVLLTFMMVMDT